ncbi:MAG: hypothetical protein QXK01_08905 [Thermofilum sp.]|uniref:hypothetical protein n=1 Tax=Thermofilum sp. TaxID=1961369 RepID=UPI00315F0F75
MSDRLALIEKIGEVVQKIVNPPQVSEQAQKWQEALQIMRQLNDLAKDIAMQDVTLKTLATALEETHGKLKALTAAVILSYLLIAAVGLLFFLLR